LLFYVVLSSSGRKNGVSFIVRSWVGWGQAHGVDSSMSFLV